ncbi:MAG TPA: class I adenylate-forming enzyme family protein [Gaiellaceae bacterium]|nr:class I adenylate-forming enzyme family protein [Gaiellaceae bacterium]
MTPVVRLLHETLLASAERVPEREAVVAGAERIAYAELVDRSLRLARALQDVGVGRGDRVAIYMDNSAGCTTAIYAAMLAGGVFVVVNPQTKEDKLLYVLDDCEAAVVVTEGSLTRTALAAAGQAPSVKAVIASSPPEGVEGALDFAEVVAAAEPEARAAGTIPVDLAALIYTSGSTGFPKGVMMTHQSMVFAAGSIAQYLRLGPDERILGLLPLAFDYGLYQLLMNVLKAGTLVLERSFAFPAQIVKRVQEEEATVFPGVPTVYATLLSMRRNMDFDLPSVRRVTNTAAALPATFHAEMARIFPNALIFAMYGLTECKRVSYLEPELLADKPTSVGQAIPGTETMVLREDRTPVEPGETGVLYVRGPHVMVGYWRKPEQTAEMIVEGPLPGERMLCAQDHFTVDEDGFLYFVGRSDDIIKTRGEKVSPIEVENAIFDIDGVKEAAVIGVPDEVLGEAIKAFVVLDEGAELTAQEIIAACRTRLENFMVPAEVVFMDALPTTATGKVRRKSLKEPVDAA